LLALDATPTHAHNRTPSTTTAAGSEQSLALLLGSISLAVKQIAAKVARAGLEGLYGVAAQQRGGSGDTQKKLDVVAVRASGLRGTAATEPPRQCRGGVLTTHRLRLAGRASK
jgi:hypothetical protein